MTDQPTLPSLAPCLAPLGLAPCPFCGGPALHDQNLDFLPEWQNLFFCRCADEENCNAFGPSSTSPQKAAEAWNKRAEPAPLAGRPPP